MFLQFFAVRFLGVAIFAAAFGGLPALAQITPLQPSQPSQVGTLERTAPLSLQSQLGAIPLISPRAGAAKAMVRAVRITQMAGRDPVGAVREIACPDSGCQEVISLVVDSGAQPFLADIRFVGHGVYVTLHPRSAAVGAVVEFRLGRAGPVFIKGVATTAIDTELSFVIAQPTGYYWMMLSLVALRPGAWMPVTLIAIGIAGRALEVAGAAPETNYGLLSWALAISFTAWLLPGARRSLDSAMVRIRARRAAGLSPSLPGGD